MCWGKYPEQRVYNDKTLKESVSIDLLMKILWANSIWHQCTEYDICSRVREESSEEDMWIDENLHNKRMEIFKYQGTSYLVDPLLVSDCLNQKVCDRVKKEARIG